MHSYRAIVIVSIWHAPAIIGHVVFIASKWVYVSFCRRFFCCGLWFHGIQLRVPKPGSRIIGSITSASTNTEPAPLKSGSS